MFLRRFFSGLQRPLAWARRTFFGVREEDLPSASPSRLTARRFFKKGSSVFAVTVLLILFLISFLLPFLIPLDLNFTDPMMANLPPTFSLRRLPRELKRDIAFIDGFSGATVGIDGKGKLYLFGATRDALTGVDLKEIPEALRGSPVALASVGHDHAYALTEKGELVGWGNSSRSQLGEGGVGLVAMPEVLRGRLDPEKVSSLVCGYQATALVYEGKLYLWGNPKALTDMEDALAQGYEGIDSVAMTRSSLLLLTKTGEVIAPDGGLTRESAVSSRVGRVDDLEAYLSDKRVVKLAASGKCFGLLTDKGEILVSGAAAYGEKDLPEDRVYTDLTAGARHFAALDSRRSVYCWGDGRSGQTALSGKVGERVFSSAEGTYLVSGEGRLLSSSGRMSYPFGTDSQGRCVFTRLVHGGRMTLTVGGVAVLISSVIAILVGLTSGYFGGFTDLLLMRLTEIFSSIPFLPFAMLLSYVLRTRPIGETARIVMIMVILGLLSWTGLAKVIRGQVLAEREKEFVTAAKGMGVPRGMILFRHILPNVLSVMLVSVTLSFAGCLLTESSLSYLGFGVQQPSPTWGNMLTGANSSLVIGTFWWQWLFPALFLSAATVAINLIGDNLRDAFDPKSERNGYGTS